MDKRLERVKGTRDLVGGEAFLLEGMARTLEELCLSYGYEPVQTPVIEPAELFLSKSGGEVASHLYAFTDPGGRQISLRPEFTASVIRAYLQGGSQDLPLRWQYRGPIFLYLTDGSPYREFTQHGAELIGASGPLADAEVLSLACEGLRRLGLQGYEIALGHLGLLCRWLEDLGVSERVRLFLLSHLGELRRSRESAARLAEDLKRQGLLTQGASRRGPRTVERQALLQGLVQDLAPEIQGSRTPEEIVSRFLSRSEGGERPEAVRVGLSLAQELAGVRGSRATALKAARRIGRRYNLDVHLLDELEEVLSLLDEQGLGEEITLDLGLARGLAYYTGMVFEARHPTLPPGPSLCGGGRYDGLVRSLGGSRDVPALGFAFSLERLAEVLAPGRIAPPRITEQALICPANTSAWGPALKMAQEMRRGGRRATLETVMRPLAESLVWARRRGISKVVAVRGDGEAEEHVVA